MPQSTNKTRSTKGRSKIRQRGLSRLGVLVVLLIWVVILVLILANRQSLFDWWRLRNYQASSTIASLANQDTMTSYARKIFYVNHPAIESKSTFSTVCPNNGGEQTIVLGCYHGNQQGIYLLSVSDPRLNGVEQVTAAHEMLHAAYDRLSSSERTQVDNMLIDYYNHDLHDQRILQTIAAYKKNRAQRCRQRNALGLWDRDRSAAGPARSVLQPLL